MKTIGILGGMSWESTSLYYQGINRAVAAQLGGLHSAPLLIHSDNFAEVAAMQKSGDWTGLEQRMLRHAQQLAQAGAQAIVIATNTMHILAPALQAKLDIPILHIAECTAHAIRQQGLHTIALLGTQFTMEKPFYKEKLATQKIETLVPQLAGREFVHSVIFNELCQGKINPLARQKILEMICELQAQGAQGVILGCTELPLLLTQSDLSIPVFDTTALHIAAAVDFIIS